MTGIKILFIQFTKKYNILIRLYFGAFIFCPFIYGQIEEKKLDIIYDLPSVNIEIKKKSLTSYQLEKEEVQLLGVKDLPFLFQKMEH